MNRETDTNDDVRFDRLVDGELSADERRRLLASLDDRPGGWRQCALAFLAAQTWRQELGRLVDEPAARATAAVAGAEPSSTAKRTVPWYAVAASVLVAFTLGLAFGGISPPSHHAAAPNLSPDQIAAGTPTPDNPVDNLAGPDDALTLWVRDETGQPRSLRVPLVDAAAVDRRLGLDFPSGVPATVRDQLHERGYQVESKRRYAPLWLDNGRPLVLPVEDTKIIPVSDRVY